MELILSGNPNINTINNVVYLTNKEYKNKIDKVLFIDTEETLIDEKDNNIEGDRNRAIRKYLGHGVKIESILLMKEGLYEVIPQIISNELKIYKENEIIVDTTNGNKVVSNILYASASLSKIKEIVFLVVSRDKHKTPPDQLTKEDYKFEWFTPITNTNIDMIGKHSYFEIFYYKDKAREFIDMFENNHFERSYLNNSFSHQLESVISNYFLENFSSAISTIGQVAEELSLELCGLIKNLAKGDIKDKVPKNFSGAVDFLRVNFGDKIRQHRGIGLQGYQQKYSTLQNIDKLLDLIRVYRNISAHPYEVLRDKEEARIILNNFIYLLDILYKSEVFSNHDIPVN